MLTYLPNTFYSNLYKNIITKALSENRSKSDKNYFENHHILPKCLFPKFSKEKSNLVLLTGREHYLCHYLLCKIYPNNNKLKYAFFSMQRSSDGQERYYTSTGYELAKKELAKVQSQKWIDNNPNNKRDLKGKNNPMYGSARFGDKNPFFGKQHTQETKTRLSNFFKGKKASKETKDKLKEIWKNRPLIKCPHCGLESKSISNMKRYHFDNCKLAT